MSTPEDVAAEIQAETTERPDYLLDRFKTVEDQARSFSEAEKEMNRLRAQADQERAEFASALEQMSELSQQNQQQTQPGLDPQTNQLLYNYQQAVENGDAATQLSIQLALQQQMIDQKLEERFAKLSPQLDDQRQADRDIAFRIAEDRVQRQYGETWDEIQPEVQSWLNSHQGYLPQTNDPVAFETVIREAATIVTNEKRAALLAQYEADRQTKLAQQTSTGSGGQFPTDTDEKKEEWQRVVDAPTGSYAQLRSRG